MPYWLHLSVCVSAVAGMSPGYSSGRRAGGLSFRSITQGSTTHTWELDVHAQTQTLVHALKGLITKPQQIMTQGTTSRDQREEN